MPGNNVFETFYITDLRPPLGRSYAEKDYAQLTIEGKYKLHDYYNIWGLYKPLI